MIKKCKQVNYEDIGWVNRVCESLKLDHLKINKDYKVSLFAKIKARNDAFKRLEKKQKGYDK